MNKKRELPNNRMRVPHLFNKEHMILAAKKLIRRKRAKGYGAKAFKEAAKTGIDVSHKDITKPEVRKVFDYLLERRLFDNRLLSRRELKDWLVESSYFDKPKLKEYLRERLWQIMADRKVRDKQQFLENFRLVLEKINLRVEHALSETRAIDYEGKKPRNKKEESERYYRENVRDHMGQRMTVYASLVDATRLAEEVIGELKREV